jgi:hypothetical protein
LFCNDAKRRFFMASIGKARRMTEKRSPAAAVYNIALAMQVIYAPIMVGGVFYNPDDPYPNMDVKIGARMFLLAVLAPLIAARRGARG